MKSWRNFHHNHASPAVATRHAAQASPTNGVLRVVLTENLLARPVFFSVSKYRADAYVAGDSKNPTNSSQENPLATTV